MKKGLNWFLGLCLAIGLIIAFTGCVTANVTALNIPFSEQCIIVFSENRIDKFLYNNIEIKSGKQNNIVPAGNQHITITGSYGGSYEKLISRVQLGDIVRSTYKTEDRPSFYIEWNSDYEFEVGKSYNIKIVNPYFSHDIDNMVKNPPSGVRIIERSSRDYSIYLSSDYIEIMEINNSIRGGFAGSSYIGTYFQHEMSDMLWDYGPSFLSLGYEPRLGIEIIRNQRVIGFSIEGGPNLGLAFPYFENYGIKAGLNYGGRIDFANNGFGLGIGGGMANGILAGWSFKNRKEYSTFSEPDEFNTSYSVPYAELDLFFGMGEEVNISDVRVCYRYYFDNNDWYNRFAMGVKWRLK